MQNGNKLALTTLWVCVCPTRINMFEQTIDKQKLSRMMDLSERIYLRNKNSHKSNQISAFLWFAVRGNRASSLAPSDVQLPPEHSVDHCQRDQGEAGQTTANYQCHRWDPRVLHGLRRRRSKTGLSVGGWTWLDDGPPLLPGDGTNQKSHWPAWRTYCTAGS